jgi:hypothetical protein
MRGERKKWGSSNGAPFIGDMAWSGGWPAGGATRRRGLREGRGAGVAVGQRGVAGSGSTAEHVRGM